MLQVMDEGHVNRIKVADYLNDLDPDDFNMGRCNKCICGHINYKFIGTYTGDWEKMKTNAAKYLGITEEQATALFNPDPIVNDYRNRPHPQDAARVMRYLAATDIVDWSVGTSKRPEEIREPFNGCEIGYDVLEETVFV